MTMRKVSIVLAFLICLFVNVAAQFPTPCVTRTDFSPNADNPFPNEIEGFKFYGNGRLSGITFGVSTIDDVRSVFGTPLKTFPDAEIYDYDSNWRIIFSYITKNQRFQRYEINDEFWDGKKVSKKFVFSPEYIGKINVIRLQPKKNFPFDPTNYTDKWMQIFRSERDGFYKYIDRYGLKYQVFDRESGRLLDESGKEVVTYTRGDIMEIEYMHPCVNDKNILVEEK